MYTEIWHKVFCPRCDNANWLSIGESMDEEIAEAFSCWKCKKAFHLDDELEVDPGDYVSYDGKKKPE